MSVTKMLAKVLTNYDSQQSVGSKCRARRIAPLLSMIEGGFSKHGYINLLDVGGTEQYWSIVPRQFLDDYRVSITIVNLPGRQTQENHGPFTFVEADGCDLACFDDRSFHIAHSNSVVEHVGDWNRMMQFAQEISRVSEEYFVQTPNFWFPLEPHCMTPFFHWLPKSIRVWLVSRFALGHWRKGGTAEEATRTVDSSRLLSRRRLRELFDDAQIVTERFFFLPKSLIALRRSK